MTEKEKSKFDTIIGSISENEIIEIFKTISLAERFFEIDKLKKDEEKLRPEQIYKIDILRNRIVHGKNFELKSCKTYKENELDDNFNELLDLYKMTPKEELFLLKNLLYDFFSKNDNKEYLQESDEEKSAYGFSYISNFFDDIKKEYNINNPYEFREYCRELIDSNETDLNSKKKQLLGLGVVPQNQNAQTQQMYDLTQEIESLTAKFNKLDEFKNTANEICHIINHSITYEDFEQEHSNLWQENEIPKKFIEKSEPKNTKKPVKKPKSKSHKKFIEKPKSKNPSELYNALLSSSQDIASFLSEKQKQKQKQK